MKIFYQIIPIVFLILQACSLGHERKVTEQEMPAEVLQAFHEAYPNAEVRGYFEKRHINKKIYEILFTYEGQRIDASYASNGRLIEVEETIAPAKLPAAAHDKISNSFKKAVIKRVEKVMKGRNLAYEVKVDAREEGALKRYALVFGEDGRLMEQNLEKKEED